ncbi:hypothetical protein BDZ89DRAFT_1056566 [Hymenopellis radicata]|nr:hypothetical protein BDZ89DRAFT_1056566 [Hymenopellis radicata]
MLPQVNRSVRTSVSVPDVTPKPPFTFSADKKASDFLLPPHMIFQKESPTTMWLHHGALRLLLIALQVSNAMRDLHET